MKRDIGYCHRGNGLGVYDRLHEEHGDYMTIAHINKNRKIVWYVPIEPEYRAEIENIAATEDPSVSISQPEQKVFRSRPTA